MSHSANLTHREKYMRIYRHLDWLVLFSDSIELHEYTFLQLWNHKLRLLLQRDHVNHFSSPLNSARDASTCERALEISSTFIKQLLLLLHTSWEVVKLTKSHFIMRRSWAAGIFIILQFTFSFSYRIVVCWSQGATRLSTERMGNFYDYYCRQ